MPRATPNAPTSYQVEWASVDDFLTASGLATEWPAFKKRLDEMNDKNPYGSRSGDIVTIMDGERGYLTVNSVGDVYPGWHGGPTKAESFVPLIFAMPGGNFVDNEGNHIPAPAALQEGYNAAKDNDATVQGNTGGSGDGYLRNWHLPYFVRDIMKAFRDE